MFFSKVFKKEEKKILFVVVKFSMQEKKDLLYNYIYYINTYLDKTIYKSGQSFKKKIRINSLSAFFEFVIIKKIKKKKLVKLKKN